MADMPIHIRPTAPLAPRALLPGDPGRALLLAQLLLDEPRMFNHHRGLWGYTGDAEDGLPLTIQSTGMGGPSIAIVVAELVDLGLKRAIRVGTAGALDAELNLGDVVIAREAIASDGTSRALGAAVRTQADSTLSAALLRAAPDARSGAIVSTDLFYERDAPERPAHGLGALAVEMEASTLFALANRRGIAAGCVLAVTDLLAAGTRVRIDDAELLRASERIGRIAAAAMFATEANRSEAAPKPGRSAGARP